MVHLFCLNIWTAAPTLPDLQQNISVLRLCLHSCLKQLGIAGLALAKPLTGSGHAVIGHSIQADVDILQLEPVVQAEGGGGAGPIQNGPQLVQEWDGCKDLEAQPPRHVAVPHEDKSMPALTTPVQNGFRHRCRHAHYQNTGASQQYFDMGCITISWHLLCGSEEAAPEKCRLLSNSGLQMEPQAAAVNHLMLWQNVSRMLPLLEANRSGRCSSKHYLQQEGIQQIQPAWPLIINRFFLQSGHVRLAEEACLYDAGGG